jgi:hypothetical protein
MNNCRARVPFNNLFRKIASSPVLRKRENTYLCRYDHIYVYSPARSGDNYLFLSQFVKDEIEPNDRMCKYIVGKEDPVLSKEDYEDLLMPFNVDMFKPAFRDKLPELLRYYCRSYRGNRSMSRMQTRRVTGAKKTMITSLRKLKTDHKLACQLNPE